jgi:deazaflavin-dependent oxidoreductase (nitroreductase family)
MHPLRRFAIWIGRNPITSRIVPSVLPRADRTLRKLTGGRGHLAPYPTLYLTSRGRKTGKPRVTPLLFVEDGDRLAVVASNFGRSRHPDWSANLIAEPRALVENGRVSGYYRARLAGGEERERYWRRLVDLYPGYGRYDAGADRTIRLFVLEPEGHDPS